MFQPGKDPDLTLSKWCLHPLFNIDGRKNIRIWIIDFDEETELLSTRSGIIDKLSNIKDVLEQVDLDAIFSKANFRKKLKAKKLTEYLAERYDGFNISPVKVTAKANRSLSAQAWLEACSKYNKKMDRGNVYSISALAQSEGRLTDYAEFRPQLAVSFDFSEEEEKEEKRRTIKQKQYEIGLVCQPKEDGERGVVYMEGDDVIIISRTGQVKPWLEKQREQMKLLFNFLPEGVILDGELTHPNGRATSQSIMSTENRRHKKMDEIVFNLFDIYWEDKVLEERIAAIDKAMKKYKKDEMRIKGTITRLENKIVHSFEELEEYFNEQVEAGKEGIVIRFLAGDGPREKSLYTRKKNKNMLKVKPVYDSEGIIVNINAGKGKFAKCAVFVLKLSNGKTFSCCAHGTLEEREKYLKKPDKYIGQKYTFLYDCWSDDGIPINPRGVAFRKDV